MHNSMLVHVTRFVAVQAQVRDQVQGELDALKDRLIYGSARTTNSSMSFEGCGRRISNQHSRGCPKRTVAPPSNGMTWSSIFLQPQVASNVLEINGSARDALTYVDHPDGMSVIAVGGDKLSRGLTLEGLSVSYYLRASKMYDTLMQMGRWFGYRDGYTDLVRLYTTGELQTWYRDITVANEELGAKFDEMSRVGLQPTRVRALRADTAVRACSSPRTRRCGAGAGWN